MKANQKGARPQVSSGNSLSAKSLILEIQFPVSYAPIDVVKLPVGVEGLHV